MADTFGFLLSDTARLLARRFDERARQHGATRAQWKALLHISRQEGINQGGLADMLDVEPITLCRMIDRMEDSGLVERRRDPRDRRAWQLFLTEKAHPVLEEMRSTAGELMGQALRDVSAAQVDQITETLNRIRENLLDPIDTVPAKSGEAAHG
ncbi:MarR family winged helix-turn-helix transcriptional regulator [Sphingomonas radiodurans]|uniref:MarR family winged helix-turn-helix transcriptional regulator n=1 Tax=Sphingomonas radiodurans TaxID=2890321 RepID=UPI001E45BB34|nr:MarR family transcriptional regulator [Sphingomonas radiodurans]WBH15991.1 MarR family transcriptional regulator [Sphingomonas radiodurans]